MFRETKNMTSFEKRTLKDLGLLQKKTPKPKWMKCLTAAEIKHLKENMERVTLERFKLTREEQRRLTNKGGMEACLTCKLIARKLGLE